MKIGWPKLGGLLGIGYCVVGFFLIFLGWNGAASNDDEPAQIPYVISGGIAGLALVVLGAALIVAHSLRTHRLSCGVDRRLAGGDRAFGERHRRRPTSTTAGIGSGGFAPARHRATPSRRWHVRTPEPRDSGAVVEAEIGGGRAADGTERPPLGAHRGTGTPRSTITVAGTTSAPNARTTSTTFINDVPRIVVSSVTRPDRPASRRRRSDLSRRGPWRPCGR